jgi:hypothetical protein
MKGDFSKWYADPNDNYNGVLHQQGRVLLDSDWNAQTQILNDWQTIAGQDIIGAGVAAVPAENPDAFKVSQAEVVSNAESVKLTVQPGRIWADGFSVNLAGQPPLTRQAKYLQPPIQSPPGTVGSIEKDVRDAVILEVWQEAFNGFQKPEMLIEPALGGPDTTERLQTAMAWRLYRLADDENCDNIRDKLHGNKGTLTVSLQAPITTTNEDCPVVSAGGYTGFEHYLYRVEIAHTNGTPKFKWSQFNGGLVGRGVFHAPVAVGQPGKVIITHNLQAIVHAGIGKFYLEVIEYDTALGNQQVIYGAMASLNNSNELETTLIFGRQPVSPVPPGKLPKTYFFRLWNGIADIANFAVDPAKLLQDGILLKFDNSSSSSYTPGDYWTFKVRAGEIPNVSPLIDKQPPEGIVYHRVPLAELHWQGKPPSEAQEIEDCRTVFLPLTQQKGCCSFTVGDGKVSHGNFDDLKTALEHLPASGGEICLLKGLHRATVEITGKRHIKIKGCDQHTQVIPKGATDAFIFRVIDSQCIVLEHMDLITLSGTAIALEKTASGTLQEIAIAHNRIVAYKEGIHVRGGLDISICHNKIRMLDKAGAGVAIYLHADDSLIERNDIGTILASRIPRPDRPDDTTPDPIDPCTDIDIIYHNIPFLTRYIQKILTISVVAIPIDPFKALGGIQIAGGSERIKVWDNQIHGGAGNGIALGSSLEAFLATLEGGLEEAEHVITDRGSLVGYVMREGTGLANITLVFEGNGGSYSTTTFANGNDGYFATPSLPDGKYKVAIASPGYKIESIQLGPFGELIRSYQINVVPVAIDLGDLLAFIYEIQIDRNDISHMGLSGIGLPQIALPNRDKLPKTTIARQVLLFAQWLAVWGNPIIGLEIRENHIFNCFQNPLDKNLSATLQVRGLGGISLGLCANLAIDRNRIETNGTSHLNPVCGIFVTYGEQIEIAHNWLANNGPLFSNPTGSLTAGKRGGIVLGASSLPALAQLSATSTAVTSIVGVTNTIPQLLGRPAARVHDNIVNQPAGQALTLLALGPVSVVNNYLNSELSGIEKLEPFVGAVFILNLGGLNRVGSPGISGAIASIGALTGTTSFTTAASLLARSNKADLRLPNGNVLFNNNQTRLGSQNTSVVSQLIFSADDIGFDGNQSDDLGGRRLSEKVKATFAINTLLWAATLRANDTRFKEVLESEEIGSIRFSLLTLGILLNNTTNNQGDHCIVVSNAAPSHPLVNAGNQVWDATGCP